MVITDCKIAGLLTDDLLFNPRSGVPYPRSAEEYRGLMDQILDPGGHFPGDPEAMREGGAYSPGAKGVKHFLLTRRSREFQGEVFTPSRDAPGLKNRIIFDADLITQAASCDAYGTPGVSYDREPYYVKRLYQADRVCFFRAGDWPVSFSAVSGYEARFRGKRLYYAIIQFLMTKGEFQGHGLSSYAIRSALRGLFFEDVQRDEPNLMFDVAGRLEDYRFRMWVAMHSGRLVPFYMIPKLVGGIAPSWEPIAQAIFGDAHERITPPEDLRGGPVPRGTRLIHGKFIPVALDRGVYRPHTRYPVVGGKVVLSRSEALLSPAVRATWLDVMGGEEGIAAGNGLYFGGVFSILHCLLPNGKGIGAPEPTAG